MTALRRSPRARLVTDNTKPKVGITAEVPRSIATEYEALAIAKGKSKCSLTRELIEAYVASQRSTDVRDLTHG